MCDLQDEVVRDARERGQSSPGEARRQAARHRLQVQPLRGSAGDGRPWQRPCPLPVARRLLQHRHRSVGPSVRTAAAVPSVRFGSVHERVFPLAINPFSLNCLSWTNRSRAPSLASLAILAAKSADFDDSRDQLILTIRAIS